MWPPWASPPPIPTPPDMLVPWYVPTGTLRYVLIGFAVATVLDLVRRLVFLKKVSFANKHVIVTGGSQGIGRAIAEQLLARGARVTLLARTESKLQTAVTELREAERSRLAAARQAPVGGEPSVQYVCADQTKMEQLTSAVSCIEKIMQQVGNFNLNLILILIFNKL